MADTTARRETVQEYLDDLQAERNSTWSRDRLVAHAAARQSLEDDADRTRFLKAGDPVPLFVLDEADGGQAVLAELLVDGPVVLLFFRFEGCPACNAALHGYRETLSGPLRELGAHLVAISPQVVGRLGAIKHRHGLDFMVASDPGARLIDELGIGFAPDEQAREQTRAEGQDLGVTLGACSWTLPYPTAVVVGTNGVATFVDVHPNWMVRTPASTILAEVRKITHR